jgi:hypothetical protein
MQKLLLGIISLFSLFLMPSCQNNGSNVNSSVNDNNRIKAVIASPRMIFDYKKLYGQWIPISEHYNDTLDILNGGYTPMILKNKRDTNIGSFLNDTNEYLFKYAAYYRFDTAGNYENGESDVVKLGRYKIDSLKCAIAFMDYDRKSDSILYAERIMFLDNKYMLTERKNGKEKILIFYLKTSREIFGWGG